MQENTFSRTDLACETRPASASPIPGLCSSESEQNGVAISEMRIEEEAAAKRLGRPMGCYVTLARQGLWKLSGEDYTATRNCLADRLRRMAIEMVGRPPDAGMVVLIAGLGNRDMTADAIGPMTVGKLVVTGHLREREPKAYAAIGCCALSAVSPGVLGQTGIETAELVRGAAEAAGAELVIAVDALAARACERLATTIQLCDRGIEPGAGVGNHRQAICRETVGVPVLGLGVPTVVDSSTLVCDALGKAGIGEISDSLRAVLENGRSFFVSPKESDLITAGLTTLLADAIEEAFTV